MLDLPAKIEALLFWKGEPMSEKKLMQILNVDEAALQDGLAKLETILQTRGITLVRLNGEVTLGTSKELSGLIETLTKEELVRDLGKAGLETLSIILYQGPILRSEIDYIRGVNSNFILRNLLIRGLIEKVQNPDDQRSFLYKPTLELISFLGINHLGDLPEYAKVRTDIEAFKQHAAGNEHQSNA